MVKKQDPKIKKPVKKPVKKIEEKKVISENLLESLPESPKEIGAEKYYEAVGRRKEAVARVRLYTKKLTDKTGEDEALIFVNNKKHNDYFKTSILHGVVESPFRKLKSVNRFKSTVKVMGGGITGQAEAIRHGLSRALVLFDSNFAKKLRKAGFLTRDSREKERRKYGLKKARKAPQWSKR